jgi:hypothetical protein
MVNTHPPVFAQTAFPPAAPELAHVFPKYIREIYSGRIGLFEQVIHEFPNINAGEHCSSIGSIYLLSRR